MSQKFFEKEANEIHGRCRCHDDSGSCEWCDVYYNGPSEAYKEELAAEPSKEQKA